MKRRKHSLKRELREAKRRLRALQLWQEIENARRSGAL